ncbi:MAG TPA: hypothetical protein ENH23_05610 [candidate division Zixibacteria bacterium]|nr:hypothetical protein [candidate division Zixibacteria bacterium]
MFVEGDVCCSYSIRKTRYMCAHCIGFYYLLIYYI